MSWWLRRWLITAHGKVTFPISQRQRTGVSVRTLANEREREKREMVTTMARLSQELRGNVALLTYTGTRASVRVCAGVILLFLHTSGHRSATARARATILSNWFHHEFSARRLSAEAPAGEVRN